MGDYLSPVSSLSTLSVLERLLYIEQCLYCLLSATSSWTFHTAVFRRAAEWCCHLAVRLRRGRRRSRQLELWRSWVEEAWAGADRTCCVGHRTVWVHAADCRASYTVVLLRRRSVRVLAAWLEPGPDSAPLVQCLVGRSTLYQQQQQYLQY